MSIRFMIVAAFLVLALFVYLSFDDMESDGIAVGSTNTESIYSAGSDRSSRRVLRNIVALKAYSYAVFNKAFDYTEKHKTETQTALLPLILKLGAKDFKRSGNLVVEFAQVTGELLNKYKWGLGKYVLRHVNGEVLRKNGIIETKPCLHVDATQRGMGNKKGLCTLISSRALGFKKRPMVLSKLAIRSSVYNKHKLKFAKRNKHAAVDAVAAWIKAGMQQRYVEFFSHAVASDKHKQQLEHAKEVQGALQAEKAAEYHARRQSKFRKVRVEAPAGAMGGAVVRRMSKYYKSRPSAKELSLQAKQHSRLWGQSVKLTLVNLIRLTQRKMTGVTVRVTTTIEPGAESVQKPQIKILGTKRQLTGTLHALPLQGQSLVQTFSSNGIGKLRKIELVATGNDKWLCDKIEAKVGDLPWVTMNKKKFWLGKKQALAHYRAKKYNHKISDRWSLRPSSPKTRPSGSRSQNRNRFHPQRRQ